MMVVPMRLFPTLKLIDWPQENFTKIRKRHPVSPPTPLTNMDQCNLRSMIFKHVAQNSRWGIPAAITRVAFVEVDLNCDVICSFFN